MRRANVAVCVLLATLACEGPGTKQPVERPPTDELRTQDEAPRDPNALETHVARLDDPRERADAFAQLERIVRGIEADPEDLERREIFATKVVPTLAERYAEPGFAPYRGAILDMTLAMARPEAVSIWVLALAVDGSIERHKHALVAIQGIREARASAAAEPLITALGRLMGYPSADMQDGQEGVLRYEIARALGELRSRAAVLVLIELLRQPEEHQPKGVYKAAIDALGKIGDPAAVDALIAVQFFVADVPGTWSIGERAVQAIGAIGEPAVPSLIATLEGQNEAVNARAVDIGIPLDIIELSAIRMLGVVGSASASASLLATMPQRDCSAKPVDPDFDPYDAITRRAFVANSLGYIGDPAAVGPLCGCRNASRNPSDLWEIVSALGRIGGDEAFACLDDIVRHGSYDPEAVVSADATLEVRWEALRWQILAASPAQAAAVLKTIKASKREVRREIDKQPWRSGVAVLETCVQDRGCYERILADTARTWFEREVAAFNLARMSKPGDLEAAASIARAFDIDDPDARVNIAWLSARVAGDAACPACVEALEQIMEAEALTKNASMQAAWLRARQTIAKLEAGPK